MRKQREDYRRRSAGLQTELQNLKLQRDDIETSAATSSPTTNSFLKENKRLQVSAAASASYVFIGPSVNIHCTAMSSIRTRIAMQQCADRRLNTISIALSTGGSLFVCKMRRRLSLQPSRVAATRPRRSCCIQFHL